MTVRGLRRVSSAHIDSAKTLKVFSTHQARVHIHIRQRHAAHLFEIKIEPLAIDGVQVGTFGGLRVRCFEFLFWHGVLLPPWRKATGTFAALRLSHQARCLVLQSATAVPLLVLLSLTVLTLRTLAAHLALCIR